MPAFLLGLFGYGNAVVRWLSKRSLAELACIALALALVVQTVRIEGLGIWPLRIEGFKSALTDAQSALKAEKDARAADRLAYQLAQIDAAEKNREEVARKEAESQRISDNAKTAYERDLAELRRLRAQGRTAEGSAGKPGASEDGAAAGGADGSDQLPLPPEELLRAQEIELQLMHLQGWVRDQLKAQDSPNTVSTP
jgi:hypothetical protein